MRLMNQKMTVVGVTLVLSYIGCSFGTGIPGSGKAAVEDRDVGEFDTVALMGSGQVTITTGPVTPLTIETDDNLLSSISTETSSGGQLSLTTTQSISPTIGPEYTGQTPSLKIVNVTGSGSIDVSGIDSDNFEVMISGSGNVKVAGRANSVELIVTGSGHVDAGELAVNAATVTITGSGSALLDAKDDVTGMITGSGSVRYYGTPTGKVSVTRTGSGTAESIPRPASRNREALPAEAESESSETP